MQRRAGSLRQSSELFVGSLAVDVCPTTLQGFNASPLSRIILCRNPSLMITWTGNITFQPLIMMTYRLLSISATELLLSPLGIRILIFAYVLYGGAENAGLGNDGQEFDGQENDGQQHRMNAV